MKTAWYQVKFDLENQARFRQNVSQAIIDRVDKALLDFKDKQKKARKDVLFYFILFIYLSTKTFIFFFQ